LKSDFQIGLGFEKAAAIGPLLDFHLWKILCSPIVMWH